MELYKYFKTKQLIIYNNEAYENLITSTVRRSLLSLIELTNTNGKET